MLIDRRTLVGALGCSVLPLRAASAGEIATPGAPARIPAETFAARPAMGDLLLSPDGTSVLARIQVRGTEMLGTYVIGTGELKAFKLPEKAELAWFRWAGNRRFIVSVSTDAQQRILGSIISGTVTGTATRLIAFDVATQEGCFIGHSDSFTGDDVLFVDPDGETLLLSVQKSILYPPAVYRHRLSNNDSTLVERAADGISGWFADNTGVVRAGLGADDRGWFMKYRPGPGQPLKRVATGRHKLFERARTGVMFFAAGRDDGYLLSNHEGGFYAVYRFDFATQTLGERVFAAPDADVGGLSFARVDQALEGITYTTDRPRVEWISPLMKDVQQGVDRAMPGRENRITSRSADNGVMLIHSGSARDPGIYYVFNLATTKMKRLVRPTEKLHARDLAAMDSVTYPARDGLTIPGYLTLPVGRAARGLPLIIMPHGGPYGVRDIMSYQPEVQFLANRGYAVLQPNYRGSEGYGVEFYKRGQGEWGRRMQDDLDDGMDWLVRRGVVDPKRACLVGSSYGGYAAAWGVTRNPERYRCASCMAGVFDLRTQLGYSRSFLTSRLYREFRTTVRGAETFDLDTVSPLRQVNRLQAPVLLVHGDADTVVPVTQSRTYAAALARAGKPHELVVLKDGKHSFNTSEAFTQYLTKLDEFLTRHNPA